MTFEELPMVLDYDEVRRVHSTAGLYLVNKSRLTAHGSPFDCPEIDHVMPRGVIENPAWRIATDAEVRNLGGGWCMKCS